MIDRSSETVAAVEGIGKHIKSYTAPVSGLDGTASIGLDCFNLLDGDGLLLARLMEPIMNKILNL